MERCWEHFPHEADMGIRGIGESKAEAFEEIAKALIGVISDLKTIRAKEKIHVSCEAADDEICVVDWLNQLIYEMAIRKMLFCNFKVRFKNQRLESEVWGEPLVVARHQPVVEVKGASYTELAVIRDPSGFWTVQCVVDV